MRFKKAELDVRTRYIADLEKRLTTYFKDYRNEQKSIIESLLKGHDTVVRLRTEHTIGRAPLTRFTL